MIRGLTWGSSSINRIVWSNKTECQVSRWIKKCWLVNTRARNHCSGINTRTKDTLKNEAPSSMAKSAPAIGAEKAAAIPAAKPQLMKSGEVKTSDQVGYNKGHNNVNVTMRNKLQIWLSRLKPSDPIQTRKSSATEGAGRCLALIG